MSFVSVRCATHKHLGCWATTSTNSDLEEVPNQPETISLTTCTKLCQEAGHAYLGFKGGKKCLCGSTFGFNGVSNGKYFWFFRTRDHFVINLVFNMIALHCNTLKLQGATTHVTTTPFCAEETTPSTSTTPWTRVTSYSFVKIRCHI